MMKSRLGFSVSAAPIHGVHTRKVSIAKVLIRQDIDRLMFGTQGHLLENRNRLLETYTQQKVPRREGIQPNRLTQDFTTPLTTPTRA